MTSRLRTGKSLTFYYSVNATEVHWFSNQGGYDWLTVTDNIHPRTNDIWSKFWEKKTCFVCLRYNLQNYMFCFKWNTYITNVSTRLLCFSVFINRTPIMHSTLIPQTIKFLCVFSAFIFFICILLALFVFSPFCIYLLIPRFLPYISLFWVLYGNHYPKWLFTFS